MPGRVNVSGKTDTPEVTRGDILAGLRALGIEPGDGVMVHSSLKSFGRVTGGARAVIDAVVDAVGDEGTILMPSFNHNAPYGRSGPGYYDPTETPTTNGAIPDLFWRMPGTFRSIQPSHAFAARGKRARAYTALHHRTLTTGRDSPLGMLWRDGGWCLFIGVTYRANTFHHVVEAVTGAPCLGYRTEARRMRLADGRMVEGRTWSWREKPCPINDKRLYDREMAPYERHATVGSSALTLFRLDDCYRVDSAALAEGRDGNPPCRGCPVRPRPGPHTVESDWDFEADRLKPDSPSWGY